MDLHNFHENLRHINGGFRFNLWQLLYEQI